MGQYCNSKTLEKNWFHWLLSSSTPALEEYRKLGILWTKIDCKKDDPRGPLKKHCFALGDPIFFESCFGNVEAFDKLPSTDDLSLTSDSSIHRLDMPFIQIDEVIPDLESKGYILELSTEQTWHAVLGDVNLMCQGIAAKFNQPSDEEQMELANEALLQVTRKLISHKLVYTPGRAPVFNLLTTTIYRCMFSIMNRRKNQRLGLQKFADDVQSGMIPRYKQLRMTI